jgi:hypothetical protein
VSLAMLAARAAKNHRVRPAPAFVAVGTLATGTAPVTGTGPTTAANDISIALVLANLANPATPSGWTLCPGSPIGSGPYFNAYWQRASGVGTPSFTAPSGGGASRVLIANYSGCITSGSPIDVADAQGNASSTTVAIPTLTTTGPNRLVVVGVGVFTSSVTGFSNSTLGSFTTRGSNGNLRLADGSLASAGSSGTSTATISSSVVSGSTAIALKS